VIERYNPWTVVNLIFRKLAEEGLHPVLGESGDPSEPAAALLRTLGIEPGDPGHGDGHLAGLVRDELADLRARLGTPVESGAESGADPGIGRP
jgi:hypothetical protein